MLLIDSNILIYALSSNSNYFEASNQLLDKVVSGEVKAAIAQQNFNEAYRVLTHPNFEQAFKASDALIALNSIVGLCELIIPNQLTFKTLNELVSKYSVVGNAYFDLYLVATMLSNGVSEIATLNKQDFELYAEINVSELIRQF